MTAQKKTENEATLEQLAANIQKGHRRCIESIKGLIAQAKGIGAWLDEAKKLVGHGRWTAWVEDNCHVSSRMAQKYRLVARHYDALVALLGTKDEWTLTEFFRLAAKMQAEAKEARAGEAGTGKSAKKAPADPFVRENREVRKMANEVEKRKQHGPLPVEKEELVREFLKEQRERLLGAIKRFADSKKAREVAGDLDSVHLGILLVESLKARLDAKELFSRPAKADATDATDASKTPEPVNRVGHHLNGRAKKTAA